LPEKVVPSPIVIDPVCDAAGIVEVCVTTPGPLKVMALPSQVMLVPKVTLLKAVITAGFVMDWLDPKESAPVLVKSPRVIEAEIRRPLVKARAAPESELNFPSFRVRIPVPKELA
jgi:hypothetical protein